MKSSVQEPGCAFQEGLMSVEKTSPALKNAWLQGMAENLRGEMFSAAKTLETWKVLGVRNGFGMVCMVGSWFCCCWVQGGAIWGCFILLDEPPSNPILIQGRKAREVSLFSRSWIQEGFECMGWDRLGKRPRSWTKTKIYIATCLLQAASGICQRPGFLTSELGVKGARNRQCSLSKALCKGFSKG